MIDINREIEKSLSVLPYRTAYYYPADFKELPVITFYTLTENNSFAADNESMIQRGYAAVDIWSSRAAECGSIAIDIDKAMTADGWTRDFSRDMPPESGIYHKNMRYVKEFILGGNNYAGN